MVLVRTWTKTPRTRQISSIIENDCVITKDECGNRFALCGKARKSWVCTLTTKSCILGGQFIFLKMILAYPIQVPILVLELVTLPPSVLKL